jgi:hypothetical protein
VLIQLAEMFGVTVDYLVMRKRSCFCPEHFAL